MRRNLDHVLHGPPWYHYYRMHEVDALAGVLKQQIEDFEPDILQIEHGHLARLAELAPRALPTVLVMHNILSRLQVDTVAWHEPRRLPGSLLEVAVMRRRERRDLGITDQVIVVTDDDARLARGLQTRARITVVPNCVHSDYFGGTAAKAEHPTLVMTASFYWPPNQGAARVLLTTILPALRQHFADAELLLVGQGMPGWLSDLAVRSPGATAVGPVADVRPFLATAWLSVAPLWTGSGSPLKVLEALASGLPVVTSSRVVRSLGLSAEDGAVGVGSPAETVAQIIELLSDEARRQRLGSTGRALVRQRFDVSVVGPLQERVWLDAVAAPAPYGVAAS